jgi:hypothetical protein
MAVQHAIIQAFYLSFPDVRNLGCFRVFYYCFFFFITMLWFKTKQNKTLYMKSLTVSDYFSRLTSWRDNIGYKDCKHFRGGMPPFFVINSFSEIVEIKCQTDSQTIKTYTIFFQSLSFIFTFKQRSLTVISLIFYHSHSSHRDPGDTVQDRGAQGGQRQQ